MILHENILRRMTAADRAKLGKAGVTHAEAVAKEDAKNEKELQRDICQELNRRGIEYNCDAMHKKRTGTPGWPDITFAINGQACAIEAKHGDNDLDPEQAKIIPKMRANGWRVAVCWTLLEAITFIREQIAAAESAALPAPVSRAGGEYLIYSRKHSQMGWRALWWRPDARGYCYEIEQAGRFSKEVAEAYADDTHGENVAISLADAIASAPKPATIAERSAIEAMLKDKAEAKGGQQ